MNARESSVASTVKPCSAPSSVSFVIAYGNRVVPVAERPREDEDACGSLRARRVEEHRLVAERSGAEDVRETVPVDVRDPRVVEVLDLARPSRAPTHGPARWPRKTIRRPAPRNSLATMSRRPSPSMSATSTLWTLSRPVATVCRFQPPRAGSLGASNHAMSPERSDTESTTSRRPSRLTSTIFTAAHSFHEANLRVDHAPGVLAAFPPGFTSQRPPTARSASRSRSRSPASSPFRPNPGSSRMWVHESPAFWKKTSTGDPVSPRIATSSFPSRSRSATTMSWVPPSPRS